jgi:hypothetical protein
VCLESGGVFRDDEHISLGRNFGNIIDLSKIAVRSRVLNLNHLVIMVHMCCCLHSHEAVVVLGRNDTLAGRRAMGAGCQESKDAEVVQIPWR